MADLTVLRDLVVIFAVAITVAAPLRRIGVPTIAGFILVGIVVGPRTLRLVSDVHQVETLAEIGVVLLLFGIGLELSLQRLRYIWRPIVIGGSLQVGVTVAVTAAIAMALGLSTGQAIFLGCVVALSSTAIVLRALERRGDIDAPHGRLALGILVFQDLCVVPMMLAIPILSGEVGSPTQGALAILRALAVVVAVLLAARLVVPRFLHLIAGTGQRDLFVLAVFLVCLGTAWATSLAGVSLALGAFLAGLVVAGSDYRHQALAEVIPLREVLTSLFFVSVGMLLDPVVLVQRPVTTFLLLLAILVGKFVLVVLMGAVTRLPTRATVLAAVAIAQVGEFSFVLFRGADGMGLLPEPFATELFAAVVLSMLVTPVLLHVAPHIAAGVGKSSALTRVLGVRTPQDAARPGRRLRDHVIIAGYGVAGQELAHSLLDAGIAYVIVDLNPDNVRQAIRLVEPAFYGDITSPDVLEHLGISEARELVIVVNDPDAAARAVRAARRLSATVPILVRTRYLAEMPHLIAAGASDVIAAEIEASVEITSRVLRRHGVQEDMIGRHLGRVRGRREEEERLDRLETFEG